MKKILYILLAVTTLSCSNDDELSEKSTLVETASLNPKNELDSYLENKFTIPYNIRVLYRYFEEEIDRTYNFTPTKYNKSIEFANVFNYLFVEPYVKVTSEQFLKEHSFNLLILIGDPAFNPDGTKLVGLANAGVKVHLTEINDLEEHNIYWLNDNILATLYHENAHTWHQATRFSTDYEKISASDYKGGNWTSSWSGTDYLKAGFITGYSSYNKDEDFVELLARYIVFYNASLDCNCATTDETRWGKNQTISYYQSIPDGFDYELYTTWKNKRSNYGELYNSQGTIYDSASIWEEVLQNADSKIRDTESFTGKEKIEQKITMMRKYLQDEWQIDLDVLRNEIRSRYPYVVGKTFDGEEVTRKDFSTLNN